MHQPFKFANHRTEDTEDTDKMGSGQLFSDGLDCRFGAGGTRVASTQMGRLAILILRDRISKLRSVQYDAQNLRITE